MGNCILTKPGRRNSEFLGYQFASGYGSDSSVSLSLEKAPSYVVYYVKMINESGGARFTAYSVTAGGDTVVSGSTTSGISNVYDNRTTKYTTFTSRAYNTNSGYTFGGCKTGVSLVAIK